MTIDDRAKKFLSPSHIIIDRDVWGASAASALALPSRVCEHIPEQHYHYPHHFSKGAPGLLGAIAAAFSSACISASETRHPRHPATDAAWLAFLAPGIGTVPLAMHQFTATCAGVLPCTSPTSRSVWMRPSTSESRLSDVDGLIQTLREVGDVHGKTPAQVAVNWCMAKGTVPIPGAKNASQAASVAGCLGWRVSEAEMQALEKAAAMAPKSPGAPFEKW